MRRIAAVSLLSGVTLLLLTQLASGMQLATGTRLAGPPSAGAAPMMQLGPPANAPPRPAAVLFTEATGAVTPVMADHLRDAVAAAEAGGYSALLVRLDTPGGLVSSMREIVKSFLAARVPVVVWVAPPGGGAASAGYIVTTAAHVAAMAPGTNIGAATPIDLQGGEVLDKVVNDAVSYARALAELRGRNVTFAEEAVRNGRSVPAQQAAELRVVDLLATTRPELLSLIDGRQVRLADGPPVTLHTAGAEIVTYDLSLTRRVLQALADPNLSFLLMTIGTLAFLYELVHPGIGAAGIVGAVFILLGLFSLSVLPVNYVGFALLLLAIGLFAAELFVPGIGVLAAGGTVCLLLAGLFLFQRPTGLGINLAVLLPTAALAGLATVGLAVVARRVHGQPPRSAVDQIVGSTGEVRRAEGSTGQVFVNGAWWNARSLEGSLEPGATVRVVGRRELELLVRREGGAS